MNRWRARRPWGIWLGLLLALVAWAGAGWASLTVSRRLAGPPSDWPLTLGIFGLVVLTLTGFVVGGVVLYRVLSALTLHYRIDRNAVTIHWLGNTAVVPMNRIAGVTIGVQASRLPTMLARSFGYRRGIGRTADGTPLVLFSTAPLAQSIVLTTDTSAYVVSPHNRDGFVQEIEERRNLGIVQGQQEGVVRTSRLSYAFWTDPGIRISLALGLLFNLLLWAVLSARYTTLSDVLALRFDATGTIVGTVPREQILALPLIGLLVWLANAGLSMAVYRLSKVGAILLLVGAIVGQCLLAVSLWAAMR